jgi:tetratricopeptide (TPR) repeat protein
MADPGKPQAGFLAGKKAVPTPAAPAAEAAPQSPAPSAPPKQDSKPAGFLKKGPTTKTADAPAEAPNNGAGVAAESPAPQAAAPAPVAAARAAAQPAAPAAGPAPGNRALAEQLLHKGLDHYDRQETDQALAAYQESIQADPTFALGHNNMGMVLIDLERYDEAIAALYESVRCDPDYAEAYNNLGFVLRRTQRQVEAASAYDRFLSLEPDVEEGERIKGWIGTVQKENNLSQVPPFKVPPRPGTQPAAPAAAAAAPAKIKKMAAWEMGETAAPVSALGEIETDAATLTKAPSPAAAPAPAAPAAAPAFAKPAAAPVQQAPAPAAPVAAPAAAAAVPASKPAAASPAAAAKAPVKPMPKPPGPGGKAPVDTPLAKIEKGMDHFADGELEQAAVLFQQIIAEDAKNAEAHTGLGKVLVRQENFNGGIEQLEKAIQLDPKDPAPYYVLGFALRAVERNVEASEAYETFLKLLPDAVETEKMRQWITHVKGAASVGAVDDTSVVEDEELNSEIDQKYKAALQRFQDGEVDNSLRDCVRILNEDAAHYRTRVLLGRVFLRQSQYDNAVEQLEGALVTRPDFPEALYFLGQAAEKRGSNDLAAQSYRRYIEVNPEGPRAERINEWLTMNAAAAATASQVQCELCLRFFPNTEVTQHEGKATCRNCLSVMGAAPVSLETPVEVVQRAVADAVTPETEKRGPSKLVMVGGIAALFAGGLAVLFFMGKLNGLLIMLHLMKPQIHADPKTDVTVHREDPVPQPITTAKLEGDPQLQVGPFAKWSFTPKLTGIESLDADPTAKGWKKELKVKNGPQGMVMDPDGNTITWLPMSADWEAVKGKETHPVEITVRGVWTDKDGKPIELFSANKQFTLSMQFGYELGPEIDLGLNPAEQVVLASGDINGDGIADLVVGTGQFRRGDVRFYIGRANTLAAPVNLDSGGRFSAIWVGDIDGDHNDDALSANWQNGKLTPYYRDGAQLSKGASIDIGPGSVAIGAGRMEDSRALQIGVLQGVSHALEITSISAERKFSELIRVPMPSGGTRGWVFPWGSEKSGAAFVAVVPLAERPLQFVPYNKGQWVKGGGTIQSSISDNDVGLVTAAAVLSGKPQRLALIVTKANGAALSSSLVVMQENAGVFTQLSKTPLSGPGLGLLARDFNQDGQDDLAVVMLEETTFYFCDPQSGELRPGPTYTTPRMRGLIVPMATANTVHPDLLLLNEGAKAHILRAVENK